MDSGLMRQHGLLTLADGQVLRLRDAAGRHLTVVYGEVWITQPGDPRDPVLGSGASFRFERDGISLVQALGAPAAVLLEEGLEPQPRPADSTGSSEADAGRHVRTERFEREVRRMRAQAVAAAFAWVVAQLGARASRLFAAVRQWLLARRPAKGSFDGLSDHLLRDVGMRRESVRFGAFGRICGHC